MGAAGAEDEEDEEEEEDGVEAVAAVLNGERGLTRISRRSDTRISRYPSTEHC